jgi:hypothetical protein
MPVQKGPDPSAIANDHKPGTGHERCKEHYHNRYPRPRYATRIARIFRSDARGRGVARLYGVFGDETVLIEPQKTRDGPDKTAIEHPAGQLVPMFPFNSFEKAGADARSRGNFFQGYAAHLAFAF